MTRTRAHTAALLVLLSASCFSAACGDEPPQRAGFDAEALKRLDSIERDNQSLRDRLKSLESARDDADEGELADDETGQGLSARYGNLRVAFQLFSDVGFKYQNRPEAGTANTNFAFGSIDFFTTAQLGDHLQVAAETVLEGSGDDVGLDQERLYAQYTFNDALYVKTGLEHTLVSRWNRLYHHGKWLELAIERPLQARFEDDAGFLPMHYVGIELGGRWSSGVGTLEYRGIVSNGRGPSPEDRQRVSDINDSKALEGSLALQPICAPNLSLGGAFRYEDVAGDDDATAAAPDQTTRQAIGSGFLQWKRGPIDVLGEVAVMGDRDAASGGHSTHVSAYLQAGYRIGAFTPYARFDFADMENGDPYLAPAESDNDKWEQLFGVRYDFADQAALKLELGTGRREDSTSGDRDWFYSVATQLAWFF